VYDPSSVHAPIYRGVNPHAHTDVLGIRHASSVGGGDAERDVVMSLVEVEAQGSWGYGTVRRALRGPRCVCPAAMTLNSSSIVCRCAHSSAVTYLHPLEGWRFFIGVGNFGFFTVFRGMVDDIPLDGSFALSGTCVRDGGKELDVVVKF
jgi:hypothetical protein